MRVIAGSAKGRVLASVPGDRTRPITDRVKSALFSILTSQGMVAGRCYLDLFGGTGAVGIEALSRGAAEVIFCEHDRTALQILRRNLEAAGVADRALVVAGDAFAYLTRPDLPVFDVIYIAPPQYQGLWLKALAAVDHHPDLLSEAGRAIVQIFPKEWSEPGLVHLALSDRRQYGSTALYFFGRTLMPPGATSVNQETSGVDCHTERLADCPELRFLAVPFHLWHTGAGKDLSSGYPSAVCDLLGVH